jgi:hypothetical protein
VDLTGCVGGFGEETNLLPDGDLKPRLSSPESRRHTDYSIQDPIRKSVEEVRTRFWWGDLGEGDHLGDPDVNGRIILKRIFKKWDREWTGLSWLRIGTGGGVL